MAKEIELKYSIPNIAIAEKILSSEMIVAELAAPVFEINMSSVYYDTDDRRLIKAKISLRRRQENDEVVYTVKTPQFSDGELSSRGEWQVNADSIEDALLKLQSCGAPDKLFKLLENAALVPCAEVSFVRKTAPLKFGADLCVDVGTFGAIPFAELELELHPNGLIDDLTAFGARCAREFSLKPEPLSKFSRARAVFSSDFK